MKEPIYIVAIEIGSSGITGAVGYIDTNETLKVVALEQQKLVDCVRYGCIQNVEEVKSAVASVISALESRANISPRKVNGVYIALGGRSMMSYKRDVETHFDEESEITGDIISKLINDARNDSTLDKEIVEIVPMGFAVDNMAHSNPIGTFGHLLKASLNIITCRPQIIKNINRVIEERLQLDINGYIVRQMALSRLVLNSEETQLGCMLVDLGAETTTVSIHKNGVLQHLITIPMGSRNITRDLTALSITEETAEKIKQQANANPQETTGMGGKSTMIDNIDDAEINNYVQYRAGEIAINIVAQIEQAGLKPTDLPSGIIIVGCGAKLNGFNTLLEFQSSLKVRKGMIDNTIHISDNRIQPNDVLDVIAVLYSVAKSSSKISCMENGNYNSPQEILPEENNIIVDEYSKEIENKPKEKIKPKVSNSSKLSLAKKLEETLKRFLAEEGYED
ncbi:MAG: hypothetical protein E7081_00725 [Bacteroidales bacterium]|nr:hypothetical protein [Bacteroidales bacterium]